MTDDRKKAVLNGFSEAGEHRRRADVVEAYYYKELACTALAATASPERVFMCSTARDEGAVAELLTPVLGICREGASGAKFARYCVMLCDARGISPSLSDMFPHTEEGDPTTVAYVTGGFGDVAFGNFRDEFARLYRTTLRPHHAAQVHSACDCVLDGEADFAIVPVRNSRDGYLRAFYRIIGEYDLKILSVSEVRSEDDKTYFALCGSDTSPLFPVPAHMEFSVRGGGGMIAAVTEAVGVHGHTVSAINSFPDTNGKSVFHFVVRSGGDLRPTLLYLNLFHPTHTVLGLYGDINKR